MTLPNTTALVDELHARVASHLDAARVAVARSVGTAMVLAYWRTGRDIVELEQGGKNGVAYGTVVVPAEPFLKVLPAGEEVRILLSSGARI